MPHFLTPRNLLWHLPTVMEFEQLRCQICMAEFTTLPSVESHLRRVHGIRQVRSHINCSVHGTVTMKSSYQWCRCVITIRSLFCIFNAEAGGVVDLQPEDTGIKLLDGYLL
jgi:hypothetical protein